MGYILLIATTLISLIIMTAYAWHINNDWSEHDVGGEKMIRLDVEKYCYNCPHFTAHVTSYVMGFGNDAENDHVITCEYSDRCTQIKKYLEEEKDD